MQDGMIRISDCTLRDARYAPGVFIDRAACLSIARQLGDIGVDEIEIGKVTFEERERSLLEAINGLGLNTACIFFCLSTRAIEDAIRYVRDIGCATVCISIPTSAVFRNHKLKRSFRAACKLMQKAVGFAARQGLRVVFSGEDASRADVADVATYIRMGADAGAHRFRFAESVACLEPGDVRNRIGFLASQSPIDLEIHCHNAHGLAVANALAAIEGGARWVSVTIGGIGERGGNTPLEPLCLYLHHFRHHHHFNPRGLKPLADEVARCTELPLHRFTPIVGDHAFQYELGNQFQMAHIYENYPPEAVGNQRHLIVGRHCDTKGIGLLLDQINKGIVADMDPHHLCHHIKRYVDTHQKALDAGELERFITNAVPVADAT